ncbi:MAG: alanine racemase [Brumimicrobium sp.]|nr:alanine racemase [Brumimicrobium sp.]
MTYNNSSVIELDKEAIKTNIGFVRDQIGEGVRLSAVVKANAYGHGISQMVPEMESHGVDHFSVFSSFEAREVHNAIRNNSTVMVMGDIASEDVEWIIENNIECFVYNFGTLERLTEAAKKSDRRAFVHIELETGMNRHGFRQEQWKKVCEYLKKNEKQLRFEGLCTHFAGAESSANYKRIKDQQSLFDKGQKLFREEGLKPQSIHTSCSAAILAYPEYNNDLVRVGILMYGLWPSTEIEMTYKLKNNIKASPIKPVLSWRSRITDISKVDTGEFIGYGNAYLAETDMKVASVPVGYGYGFNRSLSNVGRVIVNGARLSVIGVVNMNMFLIDASNVDVKINDQVTIIGEDGDKSINVSHFGNLSDTLNYELLTRIDKDIRRILV